MKTATRRPSTERDGPESQLDRDHGNVFQLADGRNVAAADEQHEIRDQHAVRIEVRGRVLRGADDEDPRVDRHRRNRRSAAVEDCDPGLALLGELDATAQVRREHLAGEASSRASAPDRRDADERSRLQVVRGRVAARARDLHQALERRLDLDDLRLGRSTPPHRDDDDLAALREQPRHVPRDRGLPDPLPRSDHGDGRHRREREKLRRAELEVRADVPEPARERLARPAHPLARPEHRLVRKVHHGLGAHVVERLHEPHAVVLASAQASPCRRPGSPRRTRTAAPRARPAPRLRGARRR